MNVHKLYYFLYRLVDKDCTNIIYIFVNITLFAYLRDKRYVDDWCKSNSAVCEVATLLLDIKSISPWSKKEGVTTPAIFIDSPLNSTCNKI